MGIDLKIHLTEKVDMIEFWSKDYEHLYFHRDYEIFEQIKGFANEGKIAVEPIKINQYKPDFSYKDAYDAPLTWVLANEFSKIVWPDMISQKNKAIFKFLTALPKDYMAILYWC